MSVDNVNHQSAAQERRRVTFYSRWLETKGMKSDLPRVCDIEHASFPSPWTEQDFRDVLRNRNVFARVLEVNSGKRGENKREVVAYIVYCHEQHGHNDKRRSIQILNLAVDEKYRRMGAARMLVGYLAEKLMAPSDIPWTKIGAEIWERNLPAQLLFKRLGFVATGIETRVNEHGEVPGVEGIDQYGRIVVYPFVLRREWLLAEVGEYEVGEKASGNGGGSGGVEASGKDGIGVYDVASGKSGGLQGDHLSDPHGEGWVMADDSAVDQVFGDGGVNGVDCGEDGGASGTGCGEWDGF